MMRAALSSIHHSAFCNHHLNELHDLLFAENAAGALGVVVDALDALVRGFDVAGFEPVDDVGLTAHRAYLDLLAHAEESGGHARIDEVCEFRVALPETLDDSRRVYARGCAEGVATEDGIVERYRPAATLRRLVAVLAQSREVVVNPAHEFQVDEQLIHRRVADALADSESRAVNLIRAALN